MICAEDGSQPSLTWQVTEALVAFVCRPVHSWRTPCLGIGLILEGSNVARIVRKRPGPFVGCTVSGSTEIAHRPCTG